MHEFNDAFKNLGFGCMRLPMIGEEIDKEQFKEMVDYFMSHGFNYFDTAHNYIHGKSELAIGECISARYPRESFSLTNKLTEDYFDSEEDLHTFFNNQLKWCNVSYFNFYLMHAQNARNFLKFKKYHAYEFAFEMKRLGKIKHVGISFHDTPEVLDEILTTYPEVEAVQIQFNYLDYENPNVQAKKCYEVCQKHHKPMLIMEPIKGGKLVNDLPVNASQIIKDLKIDNPAELALRFVGSFDNIYMILSGMSNMEQMKSNVNLFENLKPLSEEEFEACKKISNIFSSLGQISCTACRYCIEGCPAQIKIPDLFKLYNSAKCYHDWQAYDDYKIITKNGGLASECLHCGACEASCPQHLEIRDLLEKVRDTFESNNEE